MSTITVNGFVYDTATIYQLPAEFFGEDGQRDTTPAVVLRAATGKDVLQHHQGVAADEAEEIASNCCLMRSDTGIVRCVSTDHL